MQKYKYASEIISLRLVPNKTSDKLQSTLNKYAADGWRLHTVQSLEMTGSILFVFEKTADANDSF